MKHHCILWYLLTDAIADLRAWARGAAITIVGIVHTRIDSIRAFMWSWYMDERQMIELIEADARAQLRAAKRENAPTIDDGFGNSWYKRCARCGKLTMEVVRPGKVQCPHCD